MSENGQQLDDRLADLIQPTEQPSKDRFQRTAVPFKTSRFDAVVCSAIVVHCVRRNWFSARSLYDKLKLFKHGVRGCLPVSDLCENGDRGLVLWSDPYAHYFPCRENAAKALVRVRGSHLDRLMDLLGFTGAEELVAAVNQLPSGTEFSDGRCPVSTLTEDEATDAAENPPM